MRIGLAGGWGYNNLGDEAILAGYVETLRDFGDLTISSRDAERTRRALRVPGHVVDEGRMPATDVAVLGGGGYLNGSWRPEIGRKLARLNRDFSRSHKRVVSSVEVRSLATGKSAGSLQRLMRGAEISVRDEESADEIAAIGLVGEVLPDGIALLTPHLARYVQPVPEVANKVLVNFLDIERRPDAHESELPASGFASFADRTIDALGDRAVGLIIGDGDYQFMKRYPGLSFITPKSARAMVSVLAQCAGIVSVRMHPALIASALEVPTVSIAYCGKVRPTLGRIGVDKVILPEYSLDALHNLLGASPQAETAWAIAHDTVRDWLTRQIQLR